MRDDTHGPWRLGLHACVCTMPCVPSKFAHVVERSSLGIYAIVNRLCALPGPLRCRVTYPTHVPLSAKLPPPSLLSYDRLTVTQPQCCKQCSHRPQLSLRLVYLIGRRCEVQQISECELNITRASTTVVRIRLVHCPSLEDPFQVPTQSSGPGQAVHDSFS